MTGLPPENDPSELDPDDYSGPPGHHGEVPCVVCGKPGYLMELDPEKGFLIAHRYSTFSCRAAPFPPGVVDGELVVPVEISEN